MLALGPVPCLCFFFFNDTATTEIYTLSLHDALPIWLRRTAHGRPGRQRLPFASRAWRAGHRASRSEEHTSELQSQSNLVCRLLLEKKKKKKCTRLLFSNLGKQDSNISPSSPIIHGIN